MRPFLLLLCIVVTATVVGCGGASTPEPTDWRPAPVTRDGLSVVAESDADGFRLHTGSGDKTFLPGVNLGSTTPLHQPGEIATITRRDYRRWLAQMGELGTRVVRVYTLHPPAFYEELDAYNRAHPQAPLYLVQGVYLPDETYNEPGNTLYSPHVDRAFGDEIRAISAAVHGDLRRPPIRGRAHGRYRTDVSPWIAAWIIGVEWDPAGTVQTNRLARHARYRAGRWFRATSGASATERWIAMHMDLLAGLETGRGVSVPIAFANWPTTDPLSHPDEPNATEDLVGVDATHVLPTRRWPAGTFASFHAYPYYPDFQRYEPGLQDTRWNGRTDPYAGYLRSLKEHFAPHMPLLVTEFGVPSSLGSAHAGTNGRDQGGHSEAESMRMDADMLRMFDHIGLGGGFVFAWTDEWFKRTWNTMEHQDPERRQLWHDPLTNEQWFGMVATDPDPIVDGGHEVQPADGPVSYQHVWADASWVHIDTTFRDALPGRARLEVDTVPIPSGADYRVDVEVEQGRAQVWARTELDPIRLDTPARPYRPDQGTPWVTYELITNREYRHRGRTLPAEFQNVGALLRGNWDPDAADVDSRATWPVDAERRTLRLRLPWSMVGLADPSARTALGPGVPARMVPIGGLRLRLVADDQPATDVHYTWPRWNRTGYRERSKAGLEVVAEAFAELAP